ncbi:nucleotidyltransferase family protein [Lentilitoribacter sp. EG35]|uniref:nucleotidyltransferase family protein n=1 Tax=Lentilitoribacter sp. EG35 TaxID=3234192 RepID=UPI0034609F8D
MIQKTDIWLETCLPYESNIQQAISNLDRVALKIILVVNASGVLEGTISDGDIRRGFLKGLNLDSPISEIIHRNPFVVSPGLSRDKVLGLMTEKQVQQVPIVNDEYRVVGLHLWDKIYQPVKRENKVVIMAGGMGKRLLPYTQDCPKPLVKVAGRPIIEYIIERAKEDGFENFIISVFHLGHMIEQHLGDGSSFGINIEYLREDKPLGTAGALSLLSPKPELPFVITNGDVITDISYSQLLDFHVQHGALATMAVRSHEWQNPFGVVETSGLEIINIVEKPIQRSHINAGIYALEPDVIDLLMEGECLDMPSMFYKIMDRKGKAFAYPMHEQWLDVGRPDDLTLAENLTEKR